MGLLAFNTPPPSSDGSPPAVPSCCTPLAPHESSVELQTDPIYSYRHSGWSRLRKAVWHALLSTDTSPTRLARFAYCGSNAWVCHAEGDPDRLRIVANYCRDRFCRPCANARARRLTATIQPFLERKRLRFVTLTLKSSATPLHSQISRLQKCFRRLRQRRLWKDHVEGGLAVLELTYSVERKQWHPHLHVLTEGKYLPDHLLKDAWLDVTGDSSIVDVRAVHGVGHAVRYIVKYIAKGVPGSILFNPRLATEAVIALTGKRVCWCVGTWHNLKLTEDLPDVVWVPIESLHALLSAAARRVPVAMEILGRLQKTDLPATSRPIHANNRDP